MDPKEFDSTNTSNTEKDIVSSGLGDIEFEQWKMGVIENEIKAYQDILGEEVIVDPMPSVITQEVVERLKFYGMRLHYIPGLDLGTLDDLKNKGTKQFLQDLQNNYPKWPIPGGEHYWGPVERESTSFPHSGGYWVAVETVDKPEYGRWYNRGAYEETEMAKALGLPGRFWPGEDNIGDWDELNYWLKEEKGKILSDIGIPNGELRLLEVLEWNLLGLRYGWGKTETSEYTNSATEGGCINFVSGGKHDKYYGAPFVMGNSLYGGAKCVLWYSSWVAQWSLDKMETNAIGWRVVVDIEKNIEATKHSQADLLAEAFKRTI